MHYTTTSYTLQEILDCKQPIICVTVLLQHTRTHVHLTNTVDRMCKQIKELSVKTILDSKCVHGYKCLEHKRKSSQSLHSNRNKSRLFSSSGFLGDRVEPTISKPMTSGVMGIKCSLDHKMLEPIRSERTRCLDP